jgi:sarcosine reductase
VRLEIESIDISDIKSASKTYVENHILYINIKDMKNLILEDNRIKSVDINLVYPGDRVRIVNLLDVIQPRCKLDRSNADFPGFIGKMQIAGSGRTRSLRNITVMVSNPHTKRNYSALLDMCGPVAEVSKYGKMKNISIAPHVAEGVEERDFEDAVKIAGLKVAVYIARNAEVDQVDDVEVFDLDIPNLEKNPELPRVAYYYQLYSPQHDHGGISDPCFYGTDVANLMPTIIHPNEVLDGAIVSPYTLRALDTYSIQNHAVIKELYRLHGKDLIFAGVVCGVANMEPVPRTRKAMMASNLIKNVLGADGVVLTKIQGGMPHVDLALVAEECEKLGVKTAVFVEAFVTSGALKDTLLFKSESVDLLITIGTMMERIQMPLEADRILGGTAESKVISSGPIEQHAGDPLIDVDEFVIAGVLDHLGSTNVTIREY